MPIPDDPDTETDIRDDLTDAMAEQGVELPAEETADAHSPSAAPEEPSEADRDPETSPADPEPPVSFSPTAKAAVAKLKAGQRLSNTESRELVQALDRREREINNGFARLRELKDITPYAEHYRAQGVTVRQALDTYTQADRMLKQDFLGALDQLLPRYGVHPQLLAGALAQKYGLPDGFAGGQAARQAQAAGMTPHEREAVQQLVQHSQGLEAQVQALQAQVKMQRAKDVAREARIAGSSISGSSAVTQPTAEPDDGDLRSVITRNLQQLGGRI